MIRVFIIRVLGFKKNHNIIKTIEDIAFQTNILALNAAVEEGTSAAEDTTAAMMEVVAKSEEVSKLIEGIVAYSAKQATATEEVSRGIDQISEVESNQATAEKSAASSEELSGQANMLRELVSKFRLKSR